MALFGEEDALTIVVRLKNEIGNKLNEVSSQLEGFKKSLEPATKASYALAGAIASAGAAVGGLGLMAVKAAADAEQMKISFTTMLGSAQDADTFIRDLINFAKKTPFTLQGLETASKQLLAYGFAQKEVLPNLKALGDIAAGVGMDKLPNLILAFGQVKAATRLTGMELRQFTEAGVPLLGELAKQTGKTAAEIQGMVSDGAIGFPMVEQALKSLSGEGGRFNDLMAKQSKSLTGMFSNLQDAWNIFLRTQGAQLLDWGKKFVTLATDIVQNHLPAWIEKVKEMIGWFGEHKTALIALVGGIVGALIPALLALGASFLQLTIAAAPWVAGGAIAALIVKGLIDLYNSSETFRTAVGWLRDALMSVWLSIKESLWPALLDLYKAIEPIIPLLKMWMKVMGAEFLAILIGATYALKVIIEVLATIIKHITDLVQVISTVLKAAFKELVSFAQPVIDTFNAIKNAVQSALDAITRYRTSGASLNPFSSSFKLPGFATGGIVPGAVGQPVPIIAHGQETIIPAGKNSGGGANISIAINNPSVRDDSDIYEIRRQVEGVFRDLLINHKI